MNSLKSMINQLKAEIREERDSEIKLYLKMIKNEIQEDLEDTLFINENEILKQQSKLNLLWKIENFIDKGESCEQEEVEV